MLTLAKYPSIGTEFWTLNRRTWEPEARRFSNSKSDSFTFNNGIAFPDAETAQKVSDGFLAWEALAAEARSNRAEFGPGKIVVTVSDTGLDLLTEDRDADERIFVGLRFNSRESAMAAIERVGRSALLNYAEWVYESM